MKAEYCELIDEDEREVRTRCSFRDFVDSVISFGLTSSMTAVRPVSTFFTVYIPVCWMYILPTIKLLMVVWTCRHIEVALQN